MTISANNKQMLSHLNKFNDKLIQLETKIKIM